MKVLIVSDSHGLTTELEKLMENYRDEVDLLYSLRRFRTRSG